VLLHRQALLHLLADVSMGIDSAHVKRKMLTMSEKRELRSTPLGLRVTPSLKSALESAANDDRRSVASMAEMILTDWLEAKGYLEKNPK